MKDYIVLLLGGNLGEREALLEQAKVQLINYLGDVVLSSSIYETEAWGGISTKDYLNQVLVFNALVSPNELLEIVLGIEELLGRERIHVWGDRTMDIDILYYADQSVDQMDLVIPHPRIKERKFVLIPLVEVLPTFIHPVYKKNHHELLANCDDSCDVKIFKSVK
jgi:2-amino-4-hydroxy-6-hydroxymethyldihydropteridine diphosphokinase